MSDSQRFLHIGDQFIEMEHIVAINVYPQYLDVVTVVTTYHFYNDEAQAVYKWADTHSLLMRFVDEKQRLPSTFRHPVTNIQAALVYDELVANADNEKLEDGKWLLIALPDRRSGREGYSDVDVIFQLNFENYLPVTLTGHRYLLVHELFDTAYEAMLFMKKHFTQVQGNYHLDKEILVRNFK